MIGRRASSLLFMPNGCNVLALFIKWASWGLVYTGLDKFLHDKNLHGSTLRLHGTGRTGRIFERLSVQVWDLKKAGPKLVHLAVQIFVQIRRSRVNARWNRASSFPSKNLFGRTPVKVAWVTFASYEFNRD